MRKASLILLIVALAAMFGASTVFAAGVVGTPHDVTSHASLKAQGTCSVCHIPHKATGDRLWASTQSGANTSFGAVGQLCSACHVGAGAYGTTLFQASLAEYYVYDTYSHALAVNQYVLTGTADDVALSGLPYATNTTVDPIDRGTAATNTIQCTTCHNVHDNAANRPFLRVNIKDLCIQCHLQRGWSGSAWLGAGGAIGAWATSNLGNANPGSHPVGTNITGEMDASASTINGSTITGDSPIIAFTSVWMQLFDNPTGALDATYADSTGVWNLGRHTATSITGNVPGTGINGGVVCVSCHAIHGVQNDESANADMLSGVGGAAFDFNPNTNLLAYPQSYGLIGGMNVANGKNQAGTIPTNGRDGLCESCHVGGQAAATGGAFALQVWVSGGGSAAYTGTYKPNPGATDFSHPIDDAAISNDSYVTQFPTNWPSGSADADGPICESCHVPHPARALVVISGGRGDVIGPINTPAGTAGAGQYILRDDAFEICNDCHQYNIAAAFTHHPTGTMNGLTGTLATPWDLRSGTGSQAGADQAIGNGDARLSCNDCHGSGRGAHNWGGAGQAGMEPDWWPVNNGRTATDVQSDELAQSAGQSATCELCHYALRGVAGGTPTMPTSWANETEFTTVGVGTHFLGNVNTGAITFANGRTDAGTLNVTTGAWPKGGWSRWGTTVAGAHLVCESCHELEPDKNEQASKLLLYFYREAADQTAGVGRGVGQNLTQSYFCEGCHSHNPGGTISHPMTGDNVTRTSANLATTNRCTSGAVPAYNQLINTYTPKAKPNGAAYTTAAGYGTFPGSNMMNCDSCHQVHDSATNSRTYILDAPEDYVGAGSDPTNYVRGGVHASASLGKDGLAHPLGNTKLASDASPDLDYTGFCDECHNYTYNLCP